MLGVGTQGPMNVDQKKKLNLSLLWGHPQKTQIQNFPFFKIETRRLLEGLKSLEDLNSSLVLSVGE